jgi:hypothetical protein
MKKKKNRNDIQITFMGKLIQVHYLPKNVYKRTIEGQVEAKFYKNLLLQRFLLLQQFVKEN